MGSFGNWIIFLDFLDNEFKSFESLTEKLFYRADGAAVVENLLQKIEYVTNLEVKKYFELFTKAF